MNTELIIERLERLLKILDIISIVLTLYQFAIENDYSFGTLLGLVSIILTVYIYILQHISQIRTYISDNFEHLRSDVVDRYFIISCFLYCIASIIIYGLCYVFQNLDGEISMTLAKMNLTLLPLLFSILIIVFKIVDNDFETKKLYIYQLVGSLPYLLFMIIGLFEMNESIFSRIAVIVVSVIFYVPFYLVSTFIVALCSMDWLENR